MQFHGYFYQTDTERLYFLLKGADFKNKATHVLENLKWTNNTHSLCQKLPNACHSFRASMQDKDVFFNRTLCMEMMYLEKITFIHMVWKETMFSAAAFLPKESSVDTWDTFIPV